MVVVVYCRAASHQMKRMISLLILYVKVASIANVLCYRRDIACSATPN